MKFKLKKIHKTWTLSLKLNKIISIKKIRLKSMTDNFPNLLKLTIKILKNMKISTLTKSKQLISEEI
jgi:hypothetical protein